MRLKKLVPYACLAAIVAGCAPQTRYAWNNYDYKLYRHYKNPAEQDQFISDVKEIIEEGEQTGKVPPGIYAEYGFALYEKGNYTEAVTYFGRENDAWPESRALMTKMIRNAQQRAQQAKQPGQAAGQPNAGPTGTATIKDTGVTK